MSKQLSSQRWHTRRCQPSRTPNRQWSRRRWSPGHVEAPDLITSSHFV
jgi:hypothetical protein